MSNTKLCKVVVVGDAQSGKSELVKKLHNQDAPFEAGYNTTIGVDFIATRPLKVSENNYVKFQVWDTSGEKRYWGIVQAYFRGSDIMVFCVDLSRSLNLAEIESQIQGVKLSSAAPLLLVCTKSDLERKVSDSEIEALNEKYQFTKVLKVSSKDNIGVDAVLNSLVAVVSTKVSNEKAEKNQTEVNQADMAKALSLLPKDSVLYQKIKALDSQLPAGKKAVIGAATLKLINQLKATDDVDARFAAIQNYEKVATGHLGSTYPKISALIVGVVLTALVTALAAAVGFGIGFLAGAWTGPGAFISGVAAGSAAACSVVAVSASLGVGLGFFGGYTSYKGAMKQNGPIHELADEARRSETRAFLTI